MTQLKSDDLLSEFPTKRLLMRYTQGFVDGADPSSDLKVGEHLAQCLLRECNDFVSRGPLVRLRVRV